MVLLIPGSQRSVPGPKAANEVPELLSLQVCRTIYLRDRMVFHGQPDAHRVKLNQEIRDWGLVVWGWGLKVFEY